MNNWEKIIEGYSKKPDNQTMKLITATVTSVTNDFYRADVRLITGQEISNLINQTPNKLHVGQNVEVGYRTTPEAGWIQIAHGEPDPMRQGGGGVQVENAALFDANDLHDYVTTTELMMDISANTKLYYGSTNRLVVAGGILCFLSSGNNLPSGETFTSLLDTALTRNSEYICPSYSGITTYYVSSNVPYRAVTDVAVRLNMVDLNGNNNKIVYTFELVSVITTTNLNTSAVSTTTYTASRGVSFNDVADVTEYGIILYTTTVGANSPSSALNPYIPNGYAGGSVSNQGLGAMLVFKNSNSSVDKWNARYDGTIAGAGSSATYINVRVGGALPLTQAETVFMLGTTQRSEPVSGGGN